MTIPNEQETIQPVVLLSCHHCGSDDIEQRLRDLFIDLPAHFPYGHCNECGACGPMPRIGETWQQAWNRRA